MFLEWGDFMEITINQNKEGINEFIKVFKTNSIVEKLQIEELFNTKAYKKLVALFGKNIGLSEKAQWIDLFYEAYNLHIKAQSYSGEDVSKKNIIAPVIWAIKNVDELDSYTNKIMNIINGKEYIRKALKYLPSIDCDVEININYYIFMYNAAVEENQILIDIAFANELNSVQLNDLLAHEIHHYLKGCINIYKEPKEGYDDLTLTLRALENEGTADMCSFEGLNYIYEHFGWMEKGQLEKVLSSFNEYIEMLNDRFQEKLINNNKSISLYSFIMNNQIVHPLGYKMASEIKNYLGIEALRQTVGKPVQFLLSFNDAFEESTGKRAFDHRVIEKLRLLY